MSQTPLNVNEHSGFKTGFETILVLTISILLFSSCGQNRPTERKSSTGIADSIFAETPDFKLSSPNNTHGAYYRVFEKKTRQITILAYDETKIELRSFSGNLPIIITYQNSKTQVIVNGKETQDKQLNKVGRQLLEIWMEQIALILLYDSSTNKKDLAVSAVSET